MNINFLKNIGFSKILNTTSKTLNMINKAIPVYKEIKPNLPNIKNILNKNNNLKENIDEIKESRPIKIKRSINKNNASNDSLTFFQ